MIKVERIIIGIVVILLIGCQPTKVFHEINTYTILVQKKKQLTKDDRKQWQHKDIEIDTIPGISLEKTYSELLKDKKGDTVIVAVLDSGFDISHEDLKDQIWRNTKEIPNNAIDDDNNGFIDDVHGWNFLGNAQGETLIYDNMEFIRIIRKYKPLFGNKTKDQIAQKDQKFYDIYQRALQDYKKNVLDLEENHEYLKKFLEAKKALKTYFPNEDYTMGQLSKIDTEGNKVLKKQISLRKHALYYEMDDDWIVDYTKYIDTKEKYTLNINHNGRVLIGDDPNVLGKANYGNNDLAGDLTIESHGTNVASVLAATRGNDIGIDGITNIVKIMPIRVTPRGDEYDKDVANAIRYATDNGARIINMSFGKEYSPNKSFVSDAIAYAAKKNVLLVSSAGNESTNVDTNPFYPNDYKETNNAEISNNFITIGASSYTLNKWICAYFSNYGKRNVDVFAPGDEMYIASPNNGYESGSGTSFSAPVVSGIAALILSYYPDLSAAEVKEILMKSGVSYNIDVEIKQEDGTKKMVPFSELSKSGKIVNAYNALLLAEQVSKGK